MIEPNGVRHIGADFKLRVERALAEIRKGQMVLVIDDEDRENEGDLIMAAELATPEALAFMIRHTSGLLCASITQERADMLDLPLMVDQSTDPRNTAFTVSIDVMRGTSTGVSSSDRALTIRALADPATVAADFSRPGHVFPLRARPGGVLRRSGHTEAASDLCRLAGLEPVGVLAELTNDDGSMSRRPELERFATKHGIQMISVADLVRYRLTTEVLVHREASGRLPTTHGQFTAIAFRSATDGIEHVALVAGDVNQRGLTLGQQTSDPVLVRVHSECLTGDVFGSRRCDCGEQLETSMARIGEVGRGVVVYLRGHEGRGVGLTHKLRAYALQDHGMDTVDANLAQGLPIDSRDYGVGAAILRELGVTAIRLMTNNPAKYRGLKGHDIDIVARQPIVVSPNPDNLSYLTTKRLRLDHQIAATDLVVGDA